MYILFGKLLNVHLYPALWVEQMLPLYCHKKWPRKQASIPLVMPQSPTFGWWYQIAPLYSDRYVLGLWRKITVSLKLSTLSSWSGKHSQGFRDLILCAPGILLLAMYRISLLRPHECGFLVWKTPCAHQHSGAVLGLRPSIRWLAVPALGPHRSRLSPLWDMPWRFPKLHLWKREKLGRCSRAWRSWSWAGIPRGCGTGPIRPQENISIVTQDQQVGQQAMCFTQWSRSGVPGHILTQLICFI